MTSATGTAGRAELIPSPYHQGSRRRTGEQVDNQFVQSLLSIMGDCRLLWLPNLTDTTTSTDSSRHAATITWSESLATFNTARARLGAGVAVAFNGTDEEGDIPDAGQYSFGDGASDSPFSLIALIKPDTTGEGVIVSKYDSGGTDREWLLEKDSSGRPSFFVHDESAGAQIGRRDATALTAGTNTLLGATYNGSKASTGIRVYKDGARVDDTTNNSGTYVAMEAGATVVGVGQARNSSSPLLPFDGSIALIAIAAREISPEEMWTIKELCDGYFGLNL